MSMICVLLCYSHPALKAEGFQKRIFHLACLEKFWPFLCQKDRSFMILKVARVELISAIKYETEIYNQCLYKHI